MPYRFSKAVSTEELYAGPTRHSPFNANLWNYRNGAPPNLVAPAGRLFYHAWIRAIWPAVHGHMKEAEREEGGYRLERGLRAGGK